jgi:GNAT superfamily N-acetyltransferase
MADGSAPVSGVTIVPFRREYGPEFRRLNLAWIERFFAVEEPDRRMLENPERAIIAAGGAIFFAVDEGGSVVGTVAMIRTDHGRCGLAKMAVSESHQRRGVGELLGRACIDWAKANRVRSVFLETNSRLDGAIRLYERLGFRRTDSHASDYARADVFMELMIEQDGGKFPCTRACSAE